MLKFKIAGLERLIVKFLNREADFYDLEDLEDLEELKELEELLKNDQEIYVFKRLVKTQCLSTLSMTEYHVKRAKELIKSRIKHQERAIRIKLYKKVGVAALMILLLGIVISMLHNGRKINIPEAGKPPHLILTGLSCFCGKATRGYYRRVSSGSRGRKKV